MTISVTCQCGTVLEAEDKHAGRTGRCSKCNARLTLPAAPKRDRDPEVQFAEFKPTIADDPAPAPSAEVETVEDEILLELPPIVRKASPPKSPPERVLDAGAYRRHFFSVWWCHWVLRIVGLLILGLCAATLAVATVLAVVVLFQSEDAMTVGGVAAIAAVWAPGFLLAATNGFCLLAAAELLTAVSWFYLRRGIGGMGPID